MAAPRSTPTTRMRELAERLRKLRVAKDFTVEAVAQRLLVSPSKISRLETAQRRASQRDVRDLCFLYEVSAEERDQLMSLSARALETTWYQGADIGALLETFIGLEEAATHVDTVQNTVLPGLLQTPDYASALIRGLRPPGHLAPDRISEILRVRLRRQDVLARANPPMFHAVIDEGALRRPIGDSVVMAGQIDRLLQASEMDHVTVQLVPVSVGSHPGLDGRFMVLRFTDQVISDTVYIEGLLGELFLERETDVARYREIFDHLTSSVALSDSESRTMLRELYTYWKST